MQMFGGYMLRAVRSFFVLFLISFLIPPGNVFAQNDIDIGGVINLQAGNTSSNYKNFTGLSGIDVDYDNFIGASVGLSSKWIEVGTQYVNFGDIQVKGFAASTSYSVIGGYSKFNLSLGESASNCLQLYLKASYGSFKAKPSYGKSDSKYGTGIGGGINLILKGFIVGADYHMYSTGFKNGYKNFELDTLGINLGYRFGGRDSSSKNNSWDTSSAQNSFDSPAISSPAEQVNNSGWAPLDDKPVADPSEKINGAAENPESGAPQPENPVAAVKKRSAEAMSEISPAAVDYNPEYTELDKDEYLALMDKLWDKEPADGKIGIPALGVLFQIGKSNILPYYNEMLNDFVDFYKNTDGKAKILIEGYSSNGGNETEKNPKLSQQRAKAVASYLIKEGIAKENLEVKAYGNTKTGSGLFSNSKGCKGGQCYRRVNVRIAE